MNPYINMTYLLCRISGEDYRLSYSEYYGTAGDALVSANGKPFSTYDKDQDNSILYNCAKLHRVRMIRRSKLPGVIHGLKEVISPLRIKTKWASQRVMGHEFVKFQCASSLKHQSCVPVTV